MIEGMQIIVCARRSSFGSVFGQEFDSPHLHQISTVILIELPCFSFCDRMLLVDEAESLSAMLDDDW